MSTPTSEVQDSDSPTTAAGAVVEVTFDRRRKRLTIEPEEVYAAPGETVTWRFHDLPPDHEPLIRIPRATKSEAAVFYTGPFTSLCLSAAGIAGTVESTATGEAPYRVLVLTPLDPDEPLGLVAESRGRVRIGDDDDGDPQSTGG